MNLKKITGFLKKGNLSRAASETPATASGAPVATPALHGSAAAGDGFHPVAPVFASTRDALQFVHQQLEAHASASHGSDAELLMLVGHSPQGTHSSPEATVRLLPPACPSGDAVACGGSGGALTSCGLPEHGTEQSQAMASLQRFTNLVHPVDSKKSMSAMSNFSTSSTAGASLGVAHAPSAVPGSATAEVHRSGYGGASGVTSKAGTASRLNTFGDSLQDATQILRQQHAELVHALSVCLFEVPTRQSTAASDRPSHSSRVNEVDVSAVGRIPATGQPSHSSELSAAGSPDVTEYSRADSHPHGGPGAGAADQSRRESTVSDMATTSADTVTMDIADWRALVLRIVTVLIATDRALYVELCYHQPKVVLFSSTPGSSIRERAGSVVTTQLSAVATASTIATSPKCAGVATVHAGPSSSTMAAASGPVGLSGSGLGSVGGSWHQPQSYSMHHASREEGKLADEQLTVACSLAVWVLLRTVLRRLIECDAEPAGVEDMDDINGRPGAGPDMPLPSLPLAHAQARPSSLVSWPQVVAEISDALGHVANSVGECVLGLALLREELSTFVKCALEVPPPAPPLSSSLLQPQVAPPLSTAGRSERSPLLESIHVPPVLPSSSSSTSLPGAAGTGAALGSPLPETPGRAATPAGPCGSAAFSLANEVEKLEQRYGDMVVRPWLAYLRKAVQVENEEQPEVAICRQMVLYVGIADSLTEEERGQCFAVLQQLWERHLHSQSPPHGRLPPIPPPPSGQALAHSSAPPGQHSPGHTHASGVQSQVPSDSGLQPQMCCHVQDSSAIPSATSSLIHIPAALPFAAAPTLMRSPAPSIVADESLYTSLTRPSVAVAMSQETASDDVGDDDANESLQSRSPSISLFSDPSCPIGFSCRKEWLSDEMAFLMASIAWCAALHTHIQCLTAVEHPPLELVEGYALEEQAVAARACVTQLHQRSLLSLTRVHTALGKFDEAMNSASDHHNIARREWFYGPRNNTTALQYLDSLTNMLRATVACGQERETMEGAQAALAHAAVCEKSLESSVAATREPRLLLRVGDSLKVVLSAKIDVLRMCWQMVSRVKDYHEEARYYAMLEDQIRRLSDSTRTEQLFQLYMGRGTMLSEHGEMGRAVQSFKDALDLATVERVVPFASAPSAPAAAFSSAALSTAGVSGNAGSSLSRPPASSPRGGLLSISAVLEAPSAVGAPGHSRSTALHDQEQKRRESERMRRIADSELALAAVHVAAAERNANVRERRAQLSSAVTCAYGSQSTMNKWATRQGLPKNPMTTCQSVMVAAKALMLLGQPKKAGLLLQPIVEAKCPLLPPMPQAGRSAAVTAASPDAAAAESGVSAAAVGAPTGCSEPTLSSALLVPADGSLPRRGAGTTSKMESSCSSNSGSFPTPGVVAHRMGRVVWTAEISAAVQRRMQRAAALELYGKCLSKFDGERALLLVQQLKSELAEVQQFLETLESYDEALGSRRGLTWELGKVRQQLAELGVEAMVICGDALSLVGSWEAALQELSLALSACSSASRNPAGCLVASKSTGESAVLCKLADVYTALDKSKTALHYFRQALEIAKDNKDLLQEYQVTIQLARLLTAVGQADSATEEWTKVSALAKEYEDQEIGRETTRNLVATQQAAKQYIDVITSALELEKIASEAEGVDAASDRRFALEALAVAYLQLGQYRECFDSLDKCEQVQEKKGKWTGRMHSLRAKALLGQNETDEAIKVLKEWCSQARFYGNWMELGLANSAMAAAYASVSSLFQAKRCHHNVLLAIAELTEMKKEARDTMLESARWLVHYYYLNDEEVAVFPRVGAEEPDSDAVHNYSGDLGDMLLADQHWRRRSSDDPQCLGTGSHGLPHDEDTPGADEDTDFPMGSFVLTNSSILGPTSAGAAGDGAECHTRESAMHREADDGGGDLTHLIDGGASIGTVDVGGTTRTSTVRSPSATTPPPPGGAEQTRAARAGSLEGVVYSNLWRTKAKHRRPTSKQKPTMVITQCFAGALAVMEHTARLLQFPPEMRLIIPHAPAEAVDLALISHPGALVVFYFAEFATESICQYDVIIRPPHRSFFKKRSAQLTTLKEFHAPAKPAATPVPASGTYVSASTVDSCPTSSTSSRRITPTPLPTSNVVMRPKQPEIRNPFGSASTAELSSGLTDLYYSLWEPVELSLKHCEVDIDEAEFVIVVVDPSLLHVPFPSLTPVDATAPKAPHAPEPLGVRAAVLVTSSLSHFVVHSMNMQLRDPCSFLQAPLSEKVVLLSEEHLSGGEVNAVGAAVRTSAKSSAVPPGASPASSSQGSRGPVAVPSQVSAESWNRAVDQLEEEWTVYRDCTRKELISALTNPSCRAMLVLCDPVASTFKVADGVVRLMDITRMRPSFSDNVDLVVISNDRSVAPTAHGPGVAAELCMQFGCPRVLRIDLPPGGYITPEHLQYLQLYFQAVEMMQEWNLRFPYLKALRTAQDEAIASGMPVYVWSSFTLVGAP